MADKPFFVIPTPLGTLTSGNALASRPVTHLGEFVYKGMVWKSSGATNLWVKADLGSAQRIDFVGMLAANAIPATTIRLRLGDSEAEVDGVADYDSTALPFIDPSITRDDGLYHSHHELPSVQTKRWIRIDIGGHTGDFQASMLVVGERISPAHYYETKWQRGIRDLGQVTFGRNGVPGTSAGEKLRSQAFTLGWLTEAEMEETFSPIDEYVGKTAPLFLCFDPAETIYRQRRTFHGYLEEQSIFTKAAYNRFERAFQFLSLF